MAISDSPRLSSGHFGGASGAADGQQGDGGARGGLRRLRSVSQPANLAAEVRLQQMQYTTEGGRVRSLDEHNPFAFAASAPDPNLA